MSYTIHLHKESFKFSVSHFTVFSPTTSERLHGHNYYLTCDIKSEMTDPKLGMAFDFNLIKPIIKKVCDEIDEYVLLPGLSPYVKIHEDTSSVDVNFSTKHYRFPKEDVKIIPVVNITSEELARYLSDRITSLWPTNLKYDSLSVSLKETAGQSVVYERPSCTP